MKEENEEGRSTEPLFPRLHVNDREKGGPKAPPRNKMALYEQFSIPSQRFNSSPASSPHKGTDLGSFASSSQSLRHERDAFTPSDMPSQLSICGDKMVYSQSVESVSLDSGIKIVGLSKKQAVNGIFNANRSASNSVRSSDSSTANQSQHKNFDNNDDFMVPTFVQSRIALLSNRNLSIMGSEGSSTLCAGNPEKISSNASPDSSDRRLKVTYLNNTRSKTAKHGHIDQARGGPLIVKDPKRVPDSGGRFSEFAKPPSVQGDTGTATIVIASSYDIDQAHGGPLIVKDPKRVPDSGGRFSEFAKPPSVQGETGTATVVIASSYDNESVHPRNCSNGAINGARCYIGIDIINERENSRVRKVSCSRISLRSGQCRPSEAIELDQSEHRAKGSPEVGDVDKNRGSGASLPHTVSSMVLCPDDVVGVIGPKHFWKARRAIVNQQRTFAIQVFELHRLIKVQKLLAASPDVLKVDVYLTKSPSKVPAIVIPAEDMEKSHEPAITQEVSNVITECPEVSTMRDPPASQNPIDGPNQVLSAPDNRANPWSFHPQQNQWLFPVMSPSEGLIYKPYVGPCSPTSGFVTPFYGSYLPVSFPPVPVDFVNPAYHALPPHLQTPFCFPSPYGLPIPRPITPSAAIGQVAPLVGLQPNVQDFQQPRSSCDVTNTRCEVISGPYQSSQASKVSEMQGSALTAPHEDAQSAKKNTLPLFLVNPNGTDESLPLESTNKDDQNRVIRVVPHTPRLATESAARIFRSIQEERQQHDL